jgi:thiamine-monophosphate kinase
MDEFGLIARYFAPLAQDEPGALGLTDDAAVLDLPAGARLVVATDAIVAGVHFLPDDPAADIARKLMRVNLSDLAAMGARPRGVLLAAVFPRGTAESWVAEFSRGLGEDVRAFSAPLVGGDTVATDGPLTLSLTALGTVDGRGALTRSAAREGDDIYVSGTIGDAALGLKAAKGELPGLDAGSRDVLIRRYRVPEPRLALGQGLVGIAHACMDVSDGLVADLGHVCDCSGLGARITAAALPVSPAARRALTGNPLLINAVLAGGDDYELVFTAPAEARDAVAAVARAAGINVARIGTMIAGQGVEISDAEALRVELKTGGYSHF